MGFMDDSAKASVAEHHIAAAIQSTKLAFSWVEVLEAPDSDTVVAAASMAHWLAQAEAALAAAQAFAKATQEAAKAAKAA